MIRHIALWLAIGIAIVADVSAAPRLRVRTLAGSTGGAGHRDATGRDARFASPAHLAIGCDGAIVLPDSANHTIRRISPDGVVTTIAGSPYMRGSADGSAGLFNSPAGVAVAPDCSVWVADTGNHTIRRISTSGTVSTVAGVVGSSGTNDGSGSAARFNDPTDLAFDPASGDAFVADHGNASIRRVTSAGRVTTLAAPTPALNQPEGVAFDTTGRLIVSELYGNAIRFRRTDGSWSRVTFKPTAYPADAVAGPDGTVYVVDQFNAVIWAVPSQGAAPLVVAGTYAKSGQADGPANSASFYLPVGIGFVSPNRMAIADSRYGLVRIFTLAGDVVTLAGQHLEPRSIDGVGAQARFRAPRHAVEATDGSFFLTDGTTVRKLARDGTVTTIAGLDGVYESKDGTGNEARFLTAYGIAIDSAGTLFVSDTFDHTLRKISQGGVVTTIVGKSGTPGTVDGLGVEARLFDPYGVAVDPEGNIYVADRGSHTIRKVAAADYRVTTIAGALGVIGGGDGPALQPRFFNPWDVDVDERGVVYVLDENTHVVQKVENGLVTTVANTDYELRSFGVAVAADGALYVCESQSSSIRRATLAGGEPFVGQRLEPGNRDGSQSRARFSRPTSIDIGPSGRMVIADTENGAIKVAEMVDGPWIDEFNAIPASVLAGDSMTLEWCTDGAQSVTITPGIGAVEPCSSLRVAPEETTNYTLTVTSSDGQATQSVTATVVTPIRRRGVRR